MRAKLRAASMTDDTTESRTDTGASAGRTRMTRRLGALALSVGLFTFTGAALSAPAFADTPSAPSESRDGGLVSDLLDRVLPILDPSESPSPDPTDSESPSPDPTDPSESPSPDPTGSPTGKPTIIDPTNVETIQRPENQQRQVDDPLPVTGVDAAMTAGAGAAMLGAGVVVLLVARRRRAVKEAPATVASKE